MSVGESFVGLLREALKTEEEELARLSSKCCVEPGLVSIREYNEGWIEPLSAKAAMRSGEFCVKCQEGFEGERSLSKVDIIIKRDGKPCGYVELKGPYKAKQTNREILEDFRKQGERQQLRADAEFLVAVFVHGKPDSIEKGIHELLQEIKGKLPNLQIQRLPAEPIGLNVPKEHVLQIAAFRVAQHPVSRRENQP